MNISTGGADRLEAGIVEEGGRPVPDRYEENGLACACRDEEHLRNRNLKIYMKETKRNSGRRLLLSFIIMAVFLFIVGILAIFNMTRISIVVSHLAERNVPALDMAKRIDNSVLLAMYDARAYSYTGDADYLEQVVSNLDEAEKLLGVLRRNAEERGRMKHLAMLERTGEHIRRYHGLLEETIRSIEKMDMLVTRSDAAAMRFIGSIGQYLSIQEQDLSDSLAMQFSQREHPPATLEEHLLTGNELRIRTYRIRTANLVLDEVTELMTQTWRAVAERKPEEFGVILERLEVVNIILQELQDVTRQHHNIILLSDSRDAANSYFSIKKEFIQVWLEKESLDVARKREGYLVQDVTRQLSQMVLNDTRLASLESQKLVGRYSGVIIASVAIGLLLALLLGLMSKKVDEIQRAHLQKGMLLRELQHRAKNSFAMIQSMIYLMTEKKVSRQTKLLLNELHARVQAISEMYQLLYATDSVNEVRLDHYLTKITESLPTLPGHVTLEKQYREITVPVKTAIPVGLIVTELLTNSLKHAFPGNRKGKIHLVMTHNETKATLEVSDDGIGFQPDAMEKRADSFGLDLVDALIGEINGNISRESSSGTRYVMSFPFKS